jgi:hypothetical protein
MELRLISPLTAEDEERLAPAVLAALGTALDIFAVPYTLKIETTGAKVFQRTNPACEPAAASVPDSGRAAVSSR